MTPSIPALAAGMRALVLLLAAGCSSGNPLGPSTAAAPAPAPAVCAPGQATASRFLVAGQSNAIFLLPSLLPGAIDCTFVGGSVEFYRTNTNFAEYGRARDLTALVWWQGAADTSTPRGEYVQKLREVFGIARAGNPALPVRIVEIPDTPDRATVRDAQREVGRDPGVQLIETADLPLDATGHFTPEGYAAVRDRLLRSLGR